MASWRWFLTAARLLGWPVAQLILGQHVAIKSMPGSLTGVLIVQLLHRQFSLLRSGTVLTSIVISSASHGRRVSALFDLLLSLLSLGLNALDSDLIHLDAFEIWNELRGPLVGRLSCLLGAWLDHGVARPIHESHPFESALVAVLVSR